VRARWHRAGDRTFIVLHTDHGVLEIGEREWAVLRCADGTRDLEGLRIAGANAGVRFNATQLAEFVGQLDALGLFGASSIDDEPSIARDLPLRALEGYRFSCTGIGTCCRSFGSILFREIDVARARAAVPEIEPHFFPEHGANSALVCASYRDGACVYLREDRCAIHAAAGAGAKPFGCRTFPVRFLDVGSEIRVLPRLECACAFEPGDEPLTQATRGSELPPEIYVETLPARTSIAGTECSPAAAIALSDSLEVPPDGDLARLVWDLASDLRPGPSVRDALARVHESAERLFTRSKWRSAGDQVLLSARAVRDATVGELRPVRARADEELYLRTAFFGVLGAERPVEDDLRRLAVVCWIARAMEEPHAIGIVEMLARGHGLDLSLT
jgi:lysine-N-methylase